MSDDYAGIARGLKQQAETNLKVNTEFGNTKAAALAGLAQVSALLAIHDELHQITLTLSEGLGEIDREIHIAAPNHDHR